MRAPVLPIAKYYGVGGRPETSTDLGIDLTALSLVAMTGHGLHLGDIGGTLMSIAKELTAALVSTFTPMTSRAPQQPPELAVDGDAENC